MSPVPQIAQLLHQPAAVRNRLSESLDASGTHRVELHVLHTVRWDGGDYRTCSCGYVVRFFCGIEPTTCDVEQAEALEAYAFRKAADASLDVVAVINRGREVKDELFGLLGIARG